jgi:hypothetical protein
MAGYPRGYIAELVLLRYLCTNAQLNLCITHIAGKDAQVLHRVNTLLGGLVLRHGTHAGSSSRCRRGAIVRTHMGYLCSFSPLLRLWTEVFCTHTAKNLRVEPRRLQMSTGPARTARTQKTPGAGGLRLSRAPRSAGVPSTPRITLLRQTPRPRPRPERR